MSKTLLDIAQTTLHSMSIMLFGLVIALVLIGASRPRLLQRFFHEFSERKYIFAFAAFTALLGGTIFVATEPVTQQTYVSENTKQPITIVESLESNKDSTQDIIETKDIEAVDVIAFSKETRNDPSLTAGQTRVAQTGKNGQQKTIYTVSYDKGAEVSRIVKSQSVIVQPQSEITIIGTLKQPANTPAAAPQSVPQAQPENRTNTPAPQAAQPNNDYYIGGKLCKNSNSWLCAQLRR